MNETKPQTMTDLQAETLRKAYLGRAKVKVVMAAKPNSAIVQILGNFIMGCFNKAIANYEAKFGL